MTEKKIELMICGAQKSGTSSLLQYILNHPKVIKQSLNELPFIIDDDIYSLGFSHSFKNYFHEPKLGETIIVAKNVGVMHSPKAIKRLYDHNPNCKIVLLLRNPIDRAYSNYYYAVRKGEETIQNFEKALEAESARLIENEFKWRHCAYLDRGNYFKQIEEFLKYFSKEQLLIYTFESFKNDPKTIITELFEKLNIDPNINIEVEKKHNEKAAVKSKFLARALRNKSIIKKIIRNITSPQFRKKLKGNVIKMNETSFEQPKMNPETRFKLIQYFEPLNKKLSQLINVDFDYWNK
jgi:tetratricopeptide (TPR) repeat protein